MKFYEAFATPVMLYNCKFSQTDQLRKMYSRGIHFDLKEEHLEGHIALNKANLQKKREKKEKRNVTGFFPHPRYTLLGIISENPN